MQRAHPSSEIARLISQIEVEQQAAQWALTGLANGVARHRFITRRMEQIGRSQEQLAALVGTQASVRMVCEILESDCSQQS